MPKSSKSINQDLENLLTAKGADLKFLDSSGKNLPTSDDAEIQQFQFNRDGVDHGTVTVSIDGLRKLTVYYDDDIAGSGDADSPTSWLSLVKHLKRFAQRHQLGFVLKDTDRLRGDMTKRAETKKLEENATKRNQMKLGEGYYGNRKMSYSDDTPAVKMVIKHNRQLDETDQRFRHIDRIFIETSDGERFGVPTTRPSRAKMFARHIAEGGAYRDERWSHLAELCEDLDTLGGFVRATRNRQQFNEGAGSMIDAALIQYDQLKESAKKLTTRRGYSKYFESYTPANISEGDDLNSTVFSSVAIDGRIERALPVLNKFGIRPSQIVEADDFSDWADRTISEAMSPTTPGQMEDLTELLTDNLPVGPNASVAIGELAGIIESPELYERLRRAAKIDPDGDARPQIIAWMQEQDDERYMKVLDRLGEIANDGVEDDEPESVQPVKVSPKKPQPKRPPPPPGGLPPLPPGGLPPLPPLPPLKESDDPLGAILRLAGKM